MAQVQGFVCIGRRILNHDERGLLIGNLLAIVRISVYICQ